LLKTTIGSLINVFVALIVVVLPVLAKNKLPLIVTLLLSVTVGAKRLPVKDPDCSLAYATIVLSVI
jgi:hypothetical protein